MRRQVHDTRAATSPLKRGLDLAAASVSLPGIGFTIRAPEDLPMGMGKVCKGSDDPRMQGNTPRIPVFGGEKLNLPARKVDLLPVDIECLGKSSPGVQQKDHEWAKML